MSVLLWVQQMTGISPQVQAQIVVGLLSAYGMNAVHLTKEHERSVLSALFWGLDGFGSLLGKVKPIFNEQIQAQIAAGQVELAAIKDMVQAQQKQLDEIHEAVKAKTGAPA